MTTEELFNRLSGSLRENLPLTLTTDEMRPLVVSLDSYLNPPLSKEWALGDQMFRGIGANGNFVQKADLKTRVLLGIEQKPSLLSRIKAFIKRVLNYGTR